MRVISAFVVSAAIVLAALFAASSASAAGTLAGEELRNTGVAQVTEFSCNASGARIVLTASGDAVSPSPFPGTWEENVVLTAGPLAQVGPDFYGPLTSFDATFRIDSGDTVITGATSLSGGGNIDFVCDEQGPDCDEFLSLSAQGTQESLSYTATISSPSGMSSDAGTADFLVSATGASCAGDVVMFGSMLEDFVRSTATVTYDDVCATARRYATDQGVASSLCEQLAAAQASELRGASDVKQRQLSAAASLVSAQRGKSLTNAQADELLALIARL
jgi:hypothetical protein